MRNEKLLQVRLLDEKLSALMGARNLQIPVKGWINSIRRALNMTRSQLAKKSQMTAGAIQKIEEREESGQISINKLRMIGDALDMKLVYGFVSKEGSLENLISQNAEKIATRIVLRTHQNMELESQEIQDEKIQQAIKDLAEDIKKEMRKSLWE